MLIGAFAFVRGSPRSGRRSAPRRHPDAWLYVLSGIVSIVFGAFLIVAPGDGALAVLFLIGFYALFAGVMYVAIGLRLRDSTRRLRRVTSMAPRSGAS